MSEIPPKVKAYTEVMSQVIEKVGDVTFAGNIMREALKQIPDGLSDYEYGRQLEEAADKLIQALR